MHSSEDYLISGYPNHKSTTNPKISKTHKFKPKTETYIVKTIKKISNLTHIANKIRNNNHKNKQKENIHICREKNRNFLTSIFGNHLDKVNRAKNISWRKHEISHRIPKNKTCIFKTNQENPLKITNERSTKLYQNQIIFSSI